MKISNVLKRIAIEANRNENTNSNFSRLEIAKVICN